MQKLYHFSMEARFVENSSTQRCCYHLMCQGLDGQLFSLTNVIITFSIFNIIFTFQIVSLAPNLPTSGVVVVSSDLSLLE